MKKYFLTLSFFLFISSNLYSQTNNCIEFYESSEAKVNAILLQIRDFESPNYLSKKELFSIVVPEFVSYSESRNKFEVLLVKSSLYFNSNSNDYSFGPFQMKLSFIKSILKNTPNFVINDTRLVKIKFDKFKLNNSDIDYLNEIRTQWKLLVLFEYLNANVHKNYSIVSLYTLYNRGGIFKKRTIFKKISCKNQSYEEWCSEFYQSFQ
jgi:hypothetical protein